VCTLTLPSTPSGQINHPLKGSPVKRKLLIIGGVLLAVSSCSSLPISATDNVCTIFSTKKSWYRAAVKLESEWQIPLQVPMAIMFHESKFRRKARPPRRKVLGVIPGKRRSTAYGYTQALDSTWQAYIDESHNYLISRPTLQIFPGPIRTINTLPITRAGPAIATGPTKTRPGFSG